MILFDCEIANHSDAHNKTHIQNDDTNSNFQQHILTRQWNTDNDMIQLK